MISIGYQFQQKRRPAFVSYTKAQDVDENSETSEEW